jgi:hypothetical protein
VALLALCLQLAVVYQQSLKNYLRGGYFAGLQGRYLYSFVAVVAVLVAVGLCRLLPEGRQRVAPRVAVVVVLGMQAIGAVTALRGFWWPEGEGLRRALAVQAAWAPFGRLTTVLAVVVVCAAAAAVLLAPARVRARQGVPVTPGGHARCDGTAAGRGGTTWSRRTRS